MQFIGGNRGFFEMGKVGHSKSGVKRACFRGRVTLSIKPFKNTIN
jgi:hypothetical protein